MKQDKLRKDSPASKKVLLGLSGGVDSTASASLLKEQGYEVTAVSLWTWQEEEDPERLERASQSAALLGLPHLILDVRDDFYQNVVGPFVAAWGQGLTPNPCVFCNPNFKFDKMAKLADELGCHYIATGHYARVGRHESDYWLYRASHRRQDQSYFLYRLPADLLERILFPLGGKSKDQARQIASRFGDPVAQARDSQDICFLAKGQLKPFLKKQGLKQEEGPFLNPQGQVVGHHSGAWQFTVGQRRHLGQALGQRMTVLAIDGHKNTVTLGDEDQAMMEAMTLTDCFWPHPPPTSLELELQLRSQGIPHPASVIVTDQGREAGVRFKQAVRFSSPGQSAVFYQGDRILGGGLVAEMTPVSPMRQLATCNFLEKKL
ncbi:MAG: tRNA 2-thiouridine(34) synthase MnmA [Clostridiaceae bacterium]|nr:tRNA 2-thiouridine(34) synthase MnmA [Clostridiaceae bacterium]